MQTATIHTRRFDLIATELRAAQSAARSHDPRRAVSAPRGRKGAVLKMADAIRKCRKADGRDPLKTPVAQRLTARKLDIGLAEIAERKLDTPAGWDEFPKSVTSAQKWEEAAGYWLISGEGWYEYSKRFGSRYQSATYLIGTDEGQRFAVRVPSSVTSVYEALEWLKPASIREAEDKDLPVKRQGDIFFRPIARMADHDMQALAETRHEARERKDGGLTIVHPQHKAVILSGKYRWRAYASTQIASRGRRAGD